MTKNRLMVTIHSQDVTEILALYRMNKLVILVILVKFAQVDGEQRPAFNPP